MEGSNGSGSHETPTSSGPINERGEERLKSEQEVIAKAIFEAGDEGDQDWMSFSPEEREPWMRMAAASVAAAMPPLPEHETATKPYPAELLDELANQLAYKYLNPGHFAEGMRDALDKYTLEVGRENISADVEKAMKTL